MKNIKEVSKQFIKDSTIYSLGPLLNKTVSFFLLPLYTAYLLPSEYGELQILLSTISVLGTIVRCGQTSAFWKYYNDEENKKIVIFNLMYIQFFIGLIILIGIISFVAFFKTNFYYLLLILFIANLLNIFIETTLSIYRANFKSKKYVFLSLSQTILILLFNILFVSYFKFSIYGIAYSYLFSYLIYSLTYFKTLKNNTLTKKNSQLLKNLYKYGFPLMIGNIFGYVISISDKYFLLYFSGNSSVGIYSFGYKFADVINSIVIQTIALAWNPIRWKVYNMDNGKEIFSKFNKNISIIMPIISFLLLFFIQLIYPFFTFNNDYHSGFSITMLITASNLLNGLYWINSLGLHFKSKTKIIMYSVIYSSIINTLLNLILISRYGMLGAALSTYFSYLFLFLYSRYRSDKVYKIERNKLFENFQIFLIGLFCIALTIFYNKLNPTLILFSPLILIFIIISFVIIFKQFDINFIYEIRKRKA